MQILNSIILHVVVDSNMLTYIGKGIYGESVTPHKFLNVCMQEFAGSLHDRIILINYEPCVDSSRSR